MSLKKSKRSIVHDRERRSEARAAQRAHSERLKWLAAADAEAPALLERGVCLGDGDEDAFFRAMERIRLLMAPEHRASLEALDKLSLVLPDAYLTAVGTHRGLDGLIGDVLLPSQDAAYFLGLAIGMRVGLANRVRGLAA